MPGVQESAEARGARQNWEVSPSGYITTPVLGMLLADPLTVQAFETTVVNGNFLALENGIANDRVRISAVELAKPILVADLDALAAASATTFEGKFAWVDSLNCAFVASDSIWLQITEAQVATTTIRDTEFAKGAGAYKVAGARVYVDDLKQHQEWYAVAQGVAVAGWFPVTGIFPYLSLSMAAGQNVASGGTLTPVSWDVENSDALNWHDPTSGTTQQAITVAQAGVYELVVACTLNSLSGSSYLLMDVTKNGAVVPASQQAVPTNALNNATNQIVMEISCAAGDILRIRAAGPTAIALAVTLSRWTLLYKRPV